MWTLSPQFLNGTVIMRHPRGSQPSRNSDAAAHPRSNPRGNGTQTRLDIHQRGAGSVPASKGINFSDAPLASLRPTISDSSSRGPSTCSVPSRAGTVLPPCDGIGRRASQFPWQGCLSRLLTLWLSFLNPTVLEAPHAHLKLDVGVTPLPGGACTLRTPATASPSALPAGLNATCTASGRTLTATTCIPWRTQTSSLHRCEWTRPLSTVTFYHYHTVLLQ